MRVQSRESRAAMQPHHTLELTTHSSAMFSRFFTRLMPLATLAVPLEVSSQTTSAEPHTHSRVELRQNQGGHWQLLRNGSPMVVKAVASGRVTPHLELIPTVGGNTIRTYTVSDPTHPTKGEDVARATLEFFDRAHALGLSIIPGIWINRQNAWIDYDNDIERIERQRDRIRAIVRLLRDHPALLVWGLGNETEHPFAKGVHEPLWRELDELARIIKEEDPNHPVMVTIAGTARWRIQALKTHCPHVDILGLNAYRAALTLPRHIDRGGWDGPVFLGEYGPLGHWEVPKTPWDAPIEQNSEDKAATYSQAWDATMSDPKGRVLGASAFLWGQKQEATGTWYGMFLETGERTPAIDHMTHAWTGQWPAKRSPRIQNITTDLTQQTVPPGTDFPVSADVTGHPGAALSYEWRVVGESGERWGQGNKQSVPPTAEGAIRPSRPGAEIDSPEIVVRTPAAPGAYRVFLFVRDGLGGGATQNIPFLVEE